MANETASESVRKPEIDKIDTAVYGDVYVCDEIDPYIEQLEKRLATVRALGAKARAALDHPDNHCTIVDTIWVGPAETLGDLLEDIAEGSEWSNSTIVEGAEYLVYHTITGFCLRVCVRSLAEPEQVVFSFVEGPEHIKKDRLTWGRAYFLGMRAAAAVIEANK